MRCAPARRRTQFVEQGEHPFLLPGDTAYAGWAGSLISACACGPCRIPWSRTPPSTSSMPRTRRGPGRSARIARGWPPLASAGGSAPGRGSSPRAISVQLARVSRGQVGVTRGQVHPQVRAADGRFPFDSQAGSAGSIPVTRSVLARGATPGAPDVRGLRPPRPPPGCCRGTVHALSDHLLELIGRVFMDERARSLFWRRCAIAEFLAWKIGCVHEAERDQALGQVEAFGRGPGGLEEPCAGRRSPCPMPFPTRCSWTASATGPTNAPAAPRPPPAPTRHRGRRARWSGGEGIAGDHAFQVRTLRILHNYRLCPRWSLTQSQSPSLIEAGGSC
jgi:hypothetical protein